MYTFTVEKITSFGKDYLMTTTYKDGVMISCVPELVESINVQKQLSICIGVKSLMEQKIQALKNIQ